MRPSLSGWVEVNINRANQRLHTQASMRPSLSGWVEGCPRSPAAPAAASFNEAQPLGLGGGPLRAGLQATQA